MALPTTLPTVFEVGNLLKQIHMPKSFPETGDLLSFCFKMGPGEATIFLVAGVLMLLFGINLYKGVVVINAALLGAAMGAFVGDKAGNEGVGGVIGAFTMAAIAMPLIKHAVAIMGAMIGAVVGAGLWRLFAMHQQDLYWVGAMLGAITFGMLSLLIFRGCIIMFTSLQGAAMAIVGLLGLLLKYKEFAPQMNQILTAKSFILPLAIFVPALVGLIFQQMPAGAAAAAKAPAKK